MPGRWPPPHPLEQRSSSYRGLTPLIDLAPTNLFAFLLLCSTLISPLDQAVLSGLPTQRECIWFTVLALVIPSADNTFQVIFMACMSPHFIQGSTHMSTHQRSISRPSCLKHYTVLRPLCTLYLLLLLDFFDKNTYHHIHRHTILFLVSLCLKIKCMHMESVFILSIALSPYSRMQQLLTYIQIGRAHV